MGAMGWMFASEIFGRCFHKGRILERFRLVEASALELHTLKGGISWHPLDGPGKPY